MIYGHLRLVGLNCQKDETGDQEQRKMKLLMISDNLGLPTPLKLGHKIELPVGLV